MQNIMLFRLLLVSLTTPEKKTLAFLSHLFAIFLFFLLSYQGRAWHAFKERKRGETCFFFLSKSKTFIVHTYVFKATTLFSKKQSSLRSLVEGRSACCYLFARTEGWLLAFK